MKTYMRWMIVAVVMVIGGFVPGGSPARAQGFGFGYVSPGFSMGIGPVGPAYYGPGYLGPGFVGGGYYGGYPLVAPAPILVPRPMYVAPPMFGPRPYYYGGFRGGYRYYPRAYPF
jgi:hypothetical protein